MRPITRYAADDGLEYDTLGEAIKRDAELKGLPYLCPKCKGEGEINGKPITQQERDKEAEAYQGFFSSPVWRTVTVGYQKIRCDVCKGHGYTAKELKPIVRTEVVGYE